MITCTATENGITYPFGTSRCERPSAGAWYCEAHGPAVQQFFPSRGQCASHEVCIDGFFGHVPNNNNYPVAYCVSADKFIDISGELLGAALVDRTVSIPYYGATGGTHAVEAVITGPRGVMDPMTLLGMEVTAQKSMPVSNAYFWDTRANKCEKCTSLGIQPVPEGTDRFVVKATMPAGVSQGRLYWFAI
ncbi:MAG: hypothetical protein Q9164_006438 [Protoblastenia rupestris]